MRRSGALAAWPLLVLLLGGWLQAAVAVEDHEEAVDDDEPAPAPRLEDQPEPPTRPYYPGPGVWAKPAAESGIDTGFVPIRLYAQKRHTETVRLLPRSAAYEDARTAEEVAAAPRLRQVLSSKKIQEVYSEEGYEDAGYDHGGYGRNAQEEEDYERKERERKPHVHYRSRPRARSRHRDYDDAHAAGSSTREQAVDPAQTSPAARSRHKVSHRQEITYAVTEVRDMPDDQHLPYEFSQASEPQPARVAIPAVEAYKRTTPKIQRRSDDGDDEDAEDEEEKQARPVEEEQEEEEEDDVESAAPVTEEFESRKNDAPPPTSLPLIRSSTPSPAPLDVEPTAEASHDGGRAGGLPVWSEEFLRSLPLQLPGVAGEDGGSASETQEDVGFLPVRAMAKPAMSASGPTEQEKLWRRIQATYSIPLVDGRPVQPARASSSSGRSVTLGTLPPQLVQPTPAPPQPRGAIAPPGDDPGSPPAVDRPYPAIVPELSSKLKSHSAEQQKLPLSPLKPKEAQHWRIAPYTEPETTATTRVDDRSPDPRQPKLKVYSSSQQELSRPHKENIDAYLSTNENQVWRPISYMGSRGRVAADSKVDDIQPSMEERSPYSALRKEPPSQNPELAETANFEVSPEQLKESKESGMLPYFDSKITSASQTDGSLSGVQSETQPQSAEYEESWKPIPSETPSRDDYVNKNRANEERLEEQENEKVETEESAPEEQDSEDHEQDEEEEGKGDKTQQAEDEEDRELWGFVPYFESKITFPSLREQLIGDKIEDGTQEYPTKSKMQKIKFKSWGVIPSYSGPVLEIPDMPKPAESEKIFLPPKEDIRQRPTEVPTSPPEIQQPEPTAYEVPPEQPPVHRDMTTFVPIKVISSSGFIETKMVPKEEVQEEEPHTEKPQIQDDELPIDVVPYFESNFTSVAENQRSQQNDNETLRQLLKLPPPPQEVHTKYQTPTPLVFGILPKTKTLPNIATIGPLHFGIFPKSTPPPLAYESSRVSPNRILPMSSRKVNKTTNATDERPAATSVKAAVTPLPLNMYPGEIFRSSPRVQAAAQVKAAASETVSATVTSPPVTSSTLQTVDTLEDMDIPPPPPPREDGWAPTYPVLASIPTEYMAQYLPLVASGASSMASLLSVLQAQASRDTSGENRRSDSGDTDFTSSGFGLSNETVPMVIWVPLNTSLGTSLLKLQGLPPTPTLASQKAASVPPQPYYTPSSAPSSAVLAAPSTSSPSTPPTEALHSAASGDSVRSLWGGPTFWSEAPHLTPEATETVEKLNSEYKAILTDKSNASHDDSLPATAINSTLDSSTDSDTTSTADITTTSTEYPATSTAPVSTTTSAAAQIASTATTTLALTASGKATEESATTDESSTVSATSTASPLATPGGKRYHLELTRDNRPQQEHQAAESQATEV